MGKSDANKVCAIAEDCFEQKMHSLGWCANYKVDQERAEIDDLNHTVTFTYINNCKARWTGSINSAEEEEKLCKYFMCEFYS